MVDLSEKNEVMNLIARNNKTYNLQPISMMCLLRSEGTKKSPKKKKWSCKCLVTTYQGEQKNHIKFTTDWILSKCYISLVVAIALEFWTKY